MSNSSPALLARYRAKAHLLLKALRGSDPQRAATAASRLRRLRTFASCSLEQLLAQRETVRLKHLLTLVAVEAGHDSWVALKRAHETQAPTLWVPQHAVMLNRWFTDHTEAAAALAAEGGYLLPFGEQCFITERAGVEVLGLDPDDPDWAAVGFDLVRPRDLTARTRLLGKRSADRA